MLRSARRSNMLRVVQEGKILLKNKITHHQLTSLQYKSTQKKGQILSNRKIQT